MGFYETMEIRDEIVTLLTEVNGVQWTDSEQTTLNFLSRTRHALI
jgi:hypothetical protein